MEEKEQCPECGNELGDEGYCRMCEEADRKFADRAYGERTIDEIFYWY